MPPFAEKYHPLIMKLSHPSIIAMCCVFFALPVISQGANPQAIMPEKHFAIFDKYCLECHDSDTEEGNVNLEDLPFDIGESIATAELWQKVLNSLNSGEMPPEKKKQLTVEEKTAFLDALSNQLVTARDLLSDSGGLITLRRLNRREYQNTLETLLGVPVDVSSLPEDTGSGGFDTAGASLFFSSDQFEQYLAVGRTALESVLASKKLKTRTLRSQPEDGINNFLIKQSNKLKDAYERGLAWKAQTEKPPTDFGFIDAARVDFETGVYNRQYPQMIDYLNRVETKNGVALINSFGGAQTVKAPLASKGRPGKYILRVRAGAYENALGYQRYLEIGKGDDESQKGEMNVLECRKVNGSLDEPEVIEIPFQINGQSNEPFLLRQRQPNSRSAAQASFRAAKAENDIGPPPALWVDWFEWEGPIPESEESQTGGDNLLERPKGVDDYTYAKSVIREFAERAFRIRGASPGFLNKLVDLYLADRKSGKSPKEALIEPLSIVLASPSFLYMGEPSPSEDSKRALTDMELAVRLSYFLWSAPPDDTLLALARQGKLSKPYALRKQTMRLLADDRSREFIAGFTHQWLHMNRLDFFQFDFIRHPDFDETIRAYARQEVYETIRTVMLSKLPIGKLLKSNFVVVNDALAEYYGIDGVEGHEFRKVSVPATSPRGGLLGTIAIHAMGSDGVRSSPVERGTWVLRSLLHNPPPPAPANVPQLSRLDGKALPARELQIAHQEEAQCAQCHRKIDPIGYGLENFNAAGKWRVEELVKKISKSKKGREVKTMVSFPVDPRGTLPDGTKFSTYFELRNEIAKHDSEFARGFTEALIEYSLGRPYGFSDRRLADQILAKAEAKKFQISEFIIALVQSKPFRTK